METLAFRLRELRKEKGLTLEQMANDLNTTKVTLSRYENGTREPKSEMLSQLSDYFNVSIDYLFGKKSNFNSIRPYIFYYIFLLSISISSDRFRNQFFSYF